MKNGPQFCAGYIFKLKYYDPSIYTCLFHIYGNLLFGLFIWNSAIVDVVSSQSHIAHSASLGHEKSSRQDFSENTENTFI